MTLRTLVLSTAISLLSASAALSATVSVFKDAGCGCCGGWIAHMRANGFTVAAADISPEQMDVVKAKAGITSDTASCHTALVDGYVVEGHVPASDVQRLITERPDAVGLAAPGMPSGSPGMEGAGLEPYDVLLIKRDGRTEIFASH
jgi:Predicted metal-binding protein